MGRAGDPVGRVGDLQLDVRRQDVEQPEPLTEQRRELVNLQLVQHTGLQRPLRRVRAMHHHIAVPGADFNVRRVPGDTLTRAGPLGLR